MTLHFYNLLLFYAKAGLMLPFISSVGLHHTLVQDLVLQSHANQCELEERHRTIVLDQSRYIPNLSHRDYHFFEDLRNTSGVIFCNGDWGKLLRSSALKEHRVQGGWHERMFRWKKCLPLMPVSFVGFMLSIQRCVRGYNIKPWDGYRRRELRSIQMHSVGADPEKTGETTSNRECVELLTNPLWLGKILIVLLIFKISIGTFQICRGIIGDVYAPQHDF